MTRQLTLEQGSDAAEAARLSQLLGMQGSLAELNRALADRIAKGEVDLQTPGLADHLWQTTMDKLAVDQPNYASYKRELERQWRSARKPSFLRCARHCAASKRCECRYVVASPALRGSDGLRSRLGMTGRTSHFPSHFGGRFSENAFGPSM